MIPKAVTLSFFAVVASLAAGAFLPTRAADGEFDINKVFWCDAGKKTGEQTEGECSDSRATILANCTSCHAITPIVKAQKTKPQWTALMSGHRDRVSSVSDSDIEKMTKFLAAHYNPQTKPPKLPPELDSLGIPQG